MAHKLKLFFISSFLSVYAVKAYSGACDVYKDCCSDQYIECIEVLGANCPECLMPEIKGPSVAGEVLSAIAGPLAMFGSSWVNSYYTSRSIIKSNQAWANASSNWATAYADSNKAWAGASSDWASSMSAGVDSCTDRFNSYLQYLTDRGASAMSPTQAENMVTQCKSNMDALGSLAGFQGMYGTAYGIMGNNPYLSGGYSSGFMNGLIGPYNNGMYGSMYPYGGNMGYYPGYGSMYGTGGCISSYMCYGMSGGYGYPGIGIGGSYSMMGGLPGMNVSAGLPMYGIGMGNGMYPGASMGIMGNMGMGGYYPAGMMGGVYPGYYGGGLGGGLNGGLSINIGGGLGGGFGNGWGNGLIGGGINIGGGLGTGGYYPGFNGGMIGGNYYGNGGYTTGYLTVPVTVPTGSISGAMPYGYANAGMYPTGYMGNMGLVGGLNNGYGSYWNNTGGWGNGNFNNQYNYYNQQNQAWLQNQSQQQALGLQNQSAYARNQANSMVGQQGNLAIQQAYSSLGQDLYRNSYGNANNPYLAMGNTMYNPYNMANQYSYGYNGLVGL